jgi:membrane protease YdiL (CAAX protease family)
MSLDPSGVRRRVQWPARVASACEALLGAAAVIGHNVYRSVPNEVPILVVLAILSMRWRERTWNWAVLGFKRPDSWSRLLLIAVSAAALRVLLGAFVVEPVTSHFWPPIKAPSGTDEIHGHLSAVLMYLPVIWLFAGFGEEIGYRGFLLNKLADMLGRTHTADVLAVLGSSVLFGFGHYYKGPAGILDSGIAGMILGAAYLISGRNLWTCVLAHGFIDTFGLFMAYLGWDN